MKCKIYPFNIFKKKKHFKKQCKILSSLREILLHWWSVFVQYLQQPDDAVAEGN